MCVFAAVFIRISGTVVRLSYYVDMRCAGRRSQVLFRRMGEMPGCGEAAREMRESGKAVRKKKERGKAAREMRKCGKALGTYE